MNQLGRDFTWECSHRQNIFSMGSTQIINQTSRPLDMKVGNYRYFTKLATVDANTSYTVQVKHDDTYIEYSLGTSGDGQEDRSVIVNSDECVDNKTIIVRERNGRYDVKMEPRASLRPPSSTGKSRWKFWEN